jgi:hypothetical protein
MLAKKPTKNLRLLRAVTRAAEKQNLIETIVAFFTTQLRQMYRMTGYVFQE